MMKHVFAVPGEFVCKRAGYLWIEHKKIAKVFRDYAPGKTLPSTPFCGVLKANEYLLMSTRVPNSFDGRYFGPIKKSAIFGQAVKL
jgi:type IV secretory pathway protease TraF